MKKVLIRGPILTRTGYGEQARFAYRALKSRPDLFDVYVIPTNWGQTGWIIEDTEERKELDTIITATTKHIQYAQQVGAPAFDVSIQVTIPQEWEKIAPINIGFTAGTETTHISLKWVESSHLVDRIIAVSEHTKEAFVNTEYTGQTPEGQPVSAKCTTPIDVVGFPTKNLTPTPVDIQTSTDFNFLSVLQWSPRKNLENTIMWFLEEFKEDENVGMIVKANIARNCHVDRLHTEGRLKSLKQRAGDHKCKLYLFHGNCTDEEMLGLYTNDNVHAFINLAHGEGFGLPIFEAAASGLPIVAPNWGGQKDYLNATVETKRKGKVRKKTRCLVSKVDYRLANIQPEAAWENVLIPESSWCYPQKSSYKNALRRVYKNYDRFNSQAKTLQASVETNFSEDVQNKKFVESVLASLDENTQAAPSQIVTL
jgi:glycosyltransferase involved in cell wall biosynthesis